MVVCQRHATAVLPPQRDPVHIVQEAGRVPRLFRTGAENFFPTGTRSPDHEGLYTDYTIPSNDKCIQVSTCRRSLLPSSSGKSRRSSVRVWGSRPHQTISYRLNYKALFPRELETSLRHSNALQSSLPFAVKTQQTNHLKMNIPEKLLYFAYLSDWTASQPGKTQYNSPLSCRPQIYVCSYYVY
jgi:hypothetical protein